MKSYISQDFLGNSTKTLGSPCAVVNCLTQLPHGSGQGLHTALSSEAGEEGIISTNAQHRKWISEKQGWNSSPGIFFRTSLGQNCHFLPAGSFWWSPHRATTLHWVTAPHLPLSFLLHRSRVQVFHGHSGHWERPHLGGCAAEPRLGPVPRNGCQQHKAETGSTSHTAALILQVNVMLKRAYWKNTAMWKQN